MDYAFDNAPPLYLPALKGDIATVRALLAAGEAPDAPCSDGTLKGETPLIAALFSNHVDVARLLLEAGAVVASNVAEKHAHYSLHGFGKGAPDAMLQLLLEYGLNPNERTPWHNETMLMRYAIKDKCNACARLLLEHGADVNARDDRQWTPLMYAACHCAGDNLRLFLEYGADINALDASGQSALLQSIIPRIYEDDYSMLTNEQEELGFYKWVNRSPQDSEELISHLQLLLSCGAAPNVHDSHGWSALLLCLAFGNAEAAHLLLEHGATLSGETAPHLHRARCCMELHGYADALKLLDELCSLRTDLENLPPVPTRRRNFFVRRDQCQGSAYINFQRGPNKWEFTGWENDGDSPCISDVDIFTSELFYLLREFIPDYIEYENYDISREQWDAISARASQLGGKPAHAIDEVREWVEARFADGEGFHIFGV